MASNLRTPRSVLTAPKKRRVFLHETKGPTRADRRAHAKSQGGFKGKAQVKGHLNRQDFAGRYQTINEPYVDIAPKPENKSKWRRWAKRFRA